MAKKPSIDDLRHEYVTSTISLRALAEKHGASQDYLLKQSAKHGWVNERKQGIKRASKKAITKYVDKQAENLTKITMTTDLLGDKLRQLAETLDPVGVDSFRDSAALMRAWKDYLSANALVRGLMTPLEDAQLDIARKRLDLDRAKADVDKSQVQEVRIVMDDGVKELMI